MAITLQQISDWLREDGSIHFYDKKNGVLTFAAGDDEGQQEYFVRAPEEGQLLEVQMQIMNDNHQFLSIKGHKHLGIVLPYLLFLNYHLTFGAWEYNPANGDIRFTVKCPVEDSTFTREQFNRTMGLMVYNGHNMARDIVAVLERGEWPLEHRTDKDDFHIAPNDFTSDEGFGDGI